MKVYFFFINPEKSAFRVIITFLQILSDGPNGDLRFLDILEMHNLKLTHVGSSFHGAFKNRENATGWGIDKMSLRRADFKNVSDMNVFLLQFCSHRWVQNKIVPKRGDELWENMIKKVKFQIEPSKQKQPNKDTKSWNLL